MSRRIYQVKNIFLTVLSLIVHLNGMAFNRDATLTLKFHVVEHLSLGNPNRLRLLQKSVGKCRFTMIDMGDDTEIPNIAYRVHCL